MNIEAYKPTNEELERLDVSSWSIWEKEESSFDWHYDDKEICYFLEGDVEVSSKEEQKMCIGKGDLVIFPKGLSCHWRIKKAVRKHYKFE